jgi:hypothetical protein
MTSIEKSRQSYHEIIGSFKNIHDKLEDWHKQKGSTEKGYVSLAQQQTAKFESNPNRGDENIDNQNQQFMYEFEKNQSYSIDSSYKKQDVKDEEILNLSHRRTHSLMREMEVHDYDKENISLNNHGRTQKQVKHINYNEREQRFENGNFINIYKIERKNNYRESLSPNQSPLAERRIISN